MKNEHMPILRPCPIDTKGCALPKRLWRWVTTVRQWEVMENWEYSLPNGGPRIIIPKGFLFDGASIPRPLWGVLSPTGLLLIPGLIHDFGYRYDYLWAREVDGTLYKYGKGRGQHFWDTIFKDVGKAVNGMVIIDSMGWATLSVAGWWAWRSNRKKDSPELLPWT